jgi:deoxyribose-phosphate aldolase
MSTPESLAAHIQSTLFAPGLTVADIERHCAEALELRFNAAMVPGNWVPLAARLLEGSAVAVASAVDFPMGIASTRGKAAEAAALVQDGAAELDIGAPIGWLRSGRAREFRDDLAAVVAAAGPAPVKVMLELPLLTPAQRDLAVDLAVDAGVAWLKNASSRQVGVATEADIAYLRSRAPAHVRVKASGGIERREQVIALLAAGAELVGTSDGAAIVGAAPRTGLAAAY